LIQINYKKSVTRKIAIMNHLLLKAWIRKPGQISLMMDYDVIPAITVDVTDLGMTAFGVQNATAEWCTGGR
jgi:hypothetical protein